MTGARVTLCPCEVKSPATWWDRYADIDTTVECLTKSPRVREKVASTDACFVSFWCVSNPLVIEEGEEEQGEGEEQGEEEERCHMCTLSAQQGRKKKSCSTCVCDNWSIFTLFAETHAKMLKKRFCGSLVLFARPSSGTQDELLGDDEWRREEGEEEEAICPLQQLANGPLSPSPSLPKKSLAFALLSGQLSLWQWKLSFVFSWRSVYCNIAHLSSACVQFATVICLSATFTFFLLFLFFFSIWAMVNDSPDHARWSSSPNDFECFLLHTSTRTPLSLVSLYLFLSSFFALFPLPLWIPFHYCKRRERERSSIKHWPFVSQGQAVTEPTQSFMRERQRSFQLNHSNWN